MQPESFYPMYTAHNAQFLSWSAMYEGRSADAIRYASEAVSKLPPEMIDMMPGFDSILSLPDFAYARFGKWDEILAKPAAPKYYPFNAAMGHYARGFLANAGNGWLPAATTELDSVKAIAAAVPPEATEFNNSMALLLSIAQKGLEGVILIKRGKTEEGLAALADAVHAEDQTRYDEPSDWLYPMRHTLGAALLKAGRASEAALVYQADPIGTRRTAGRSTARPKASARRARPRTPRRSRSVSPRPGPAPTSRSRIELLRATVSAAPRGSRASARSGARRTRPP
jgi:hypothetical protein